MGTKGNTGKDGTYRDSSGTIKGSTDANGVRRDENNNITGYVKKDGNVYDTNNNHLGSTDRSGTHRGSNGNITGSRDSNGNHSDNSSCYITTACVETKGLPDNCFELESLRNFREVFLLKSKDGLEAVKRYYKIAPEIVKNIYTDEHFKDVYNDLYQKLVLGSLQFIARGRNYEAFKNYEKITLDLEQRYGDNESKILRKPSNTLEL